PQKTRRAALTPARRSWRRPLLLETLEDRVVPAIPNGTLVVATFDFFGLNQFPAGIIGVNPDGTQFRISTGGMFSEPTDVTDTPNGQLYVADNRAFGGAVIKVDPNTGAQTLWASGGFLNFANVITFVNGFLYVASEDITGTIHNLVQVDPNVQNTQH